MMPRWDTLSWWASVPFFAGLVLAMVTGKDSFLLLLVAAYMLRPTLYALNLGTRFADERQLAIQYRSGNLAFAVLLAAIIAFVVKSRVEGKPADDFMLLLVKRWPTIGAVVFGLLSLAAFYFITFKTGYVFNMHQLAAALVVSVPLGGAAYSFYRGARSETEGGARARLPAGA